MVKIRHSGWQKSVVYPPLGHRKQRKVKLDRLEFLCVPIYYILLPYSMVEFVPCDQLLQKAHCHGTSLCSLPYLLKVLFCLLFFSTWLVSLQRRRSSPDGIAENILGVYLNVKSKSHGLGVFLNLM